MAQKIYLQEHVSSQAPARATRGGQEPDDLWLEGEPGLILNHPEEWFSKLKTRVEPQPDYFGLRVRFFMQPSLENRSIDFLTLLKAFLDGLSWRFEGLFLNAELGSGLQPGVHIAWDSHAPAVATQLWIKDKNRAEGKLPRVRPPFRVNILLHDLCQGYLEMWNDGTMDWLLQTMWKRSQVVQPGAVRALFLARSNTCETGVSVGLEGTTTGETGKASRPLGARTRAV